MIENGSYLLSIIIPSFNDARIIEAIKSVRAFDDSCTVKLVIIDGGSKPELVDVIRSYLNAADTLVSEPDKGIFDALNKGLQICHTKYLGWLGSDDWFSGYLKASEVVDILQQYDLLIANTKHVRNSRVVRQTHSWPIRYNLHFVGMNCPHFSAFGRTELFKTRRFELGIKGSDIDFFLKIFDQKPKVYTTAKVSTYMTEGGFSNSSYRAILQINKELVPIYRLYQPTLVAYISVINKLVYKLASKFYYLCKKQYIEPNNL